MSEVMTVNGKEFEIIKLLGKGKGGYSYLATDGVKNYVLKQIHHEPCIRSRNWMSTRLLSRRIIGFV